MDAFAFLKIAAAVEVSKIILFCNSLPTSTVAKSSALRVLFLQVKISRLMSSILSSRDSSTLLRYIPIVFVSYFCITGNWARRFVRFTFALAVLFCFL